MVGFIEQVPYEGNFALIQNWSSHFSTQPTSYWSISHGGDLIANGTITEPESHFEFGCSAFSSAVQALAQYISESEWQAREARERFCRTNILSNAVSKNGHLSFLVPKHEEVRIETAARDHVVHLEVITLAEEKEAPGISAVGQILISGGKLWKILRNRLSKFSSRSLQRTLPSGFAAGGFGFASAKPLLQY